MVSFILNLAESTWSMLVDSAFLLLLGLLLAGLLSVFLNAGRIGRILSGSKRSQVFRAALFGIPLPLCSCSVLPVAHQLRKSGVSKAGTVSFLISTPESGVDSILLTYTLTDPIMTVARPVTAFLTAFAAGTLESSAGDEATLDPGDDQTSADSCGDSCGCGNKDGDISDRQPLAHRIWSGLKYSMTDLLSDLAPYLLLGYILAGLITVLIGEESLAESGSMLAGWGGYVGAILIGLPLYICATSSTPMAAAMLAGGFSPGAVLVFLMVGPATNAASLVVVSKILRGGALVRYLLTILVVSVLCGLAIDQIYELWPQQVWSSEMVAHTSGSLLAEISAFILSALVLYYSLRSLVKKLSR